MVPRLLDYGAYTEARYGRLDIRWESCYYRLAILRSQCVIRDFFLGFIKVHILHHAAYTPVYSMALIEELAHHGYELSLGTLYLLLHTMEEQGYLVHSERIVEGRVRKHYAITNDECAALREARLRIRELVQEVLEESAPVEKDG
jgi:PadR family transcriptional regulator, regulatory protein PadR